MSAIPHSRMGRLRFAAEALGVAAPEGLPVNLLADDDGPHKAVLRFCADNGVSLDFIYLGDVQGMLREVARYRKAA